MPKSTVKTKAPNARYWTVRRVLIDRQGYDDMGWYWGVDKPLYWYSSPDGKVTGHTRSHDRAAVFALLQDMEHAS